MNTRHNASVLRLLAGLLLATVLSAFTPVAAGQEVSQSMLQAQWQQLETTDWIAEGAAKPQHVLYAFIDPNCPYCHDFWRDAQTQYKHGLQVRYILVGIISDTSPTKAAAILEADDPLKALRQNELAWGASPGGSPGGGIAPLRQLDFSMRLKLMMHSKLAREFGILGTPGLVWKDRSGTIHVLQSAPRPAELSQIVESAAGA
ncbi:MAG TPA: thiol:disulfide interchange protein DsbG [Gammaproteobacteria bacterium]